MAESQLVPLIAAIYEYQAAYLEPKLKKIGLSLGSFQLLAAVHAAGEGASQIDIARRLGIAPATLSETVQIQVNNGMLEQVTSKVDRRVKSLVLTNDAKKKLEEVRKMIQQLEQAMLAKLPPANLNVTLSTLETVLDNVEEILEN
ncbi:MAG: winged helix-turn-helix transcriptional regulator [Armatimonadetes bacterium]|nr:winged helix-turn-helix transcriptional regulator [Armatimonadota bacterium]